ncbi:hypothetical protein GCM10020358_27610 [Amorphoplanes nipponensis]
MKKSLRRALWAGAIVAVATAAVPVVQASAAAACAPAWSASAVYVKDNTVSYQAKNYTAKWWTQNEVPTASGEWGVWADKGACGGTTPPPTTPPVTTPPTTTPPPTTPTTPPTTQPPGSAGKNVVGYFAEWGVYGRNYHVKNLVTSGSAAKLTHILYAFGNTTGGQCSIGDAYADYDKAYTAADSVDGVADTWDTGALRGSFNQLRKLKKLYPNIKVIWSFGGWTWSGGFTQAAANPTAFANSCYNLVKDSRWSDVFDGIDVDWEYPNACGLQCDASAPGLTYNRSSRPCAPSSARASWSPRAISADGSNGGKLDAADYASGISKLNLVFPMTYDYFGAFAAQGPTAPHSPLTSYTGIPQAGLLVRRGDPEAEEARASRRTRCCWGIGFYGRGWTASSPRTAPGGTATGRGAGHLRGRHRGLQGPQNSCPASRCNRGRHRLRQVRQQLVELRHPEHHRRQDDLRQAAGSGRRVLLGVLRRHRQRRADHRHPRTVSTDLFLGSGGAGDPPGAPFRCTDRLPTCAESGISSVIPGSGPPPCRPPPVHHSAEDSALGLDTWRELPRLQIRRRGRTWTKVRLGLPVLDTVPPSIVRGGGGGGGAVRGRPAWRHGLAEVCEGRAFPAAGRRRARPSPTTPRATCWPNARTLLQMAVC